jgi:hypothetical protein
MKYLFHLLINIILPITCIAQITTSNSAAATGQKDSLLQNIVSGLNAYSSTHITEKVYLHLDKTLYAPGDTVWYKAYTVIGGRHQLSALSGVLHVELINPGDSVVSRQLVQLTSGTAGSNIPLPIKIKEGNYHVRAYTNWMRNDGVEYFYNQRIRIGLPSSASISKQNMQARPDVQFFPEGGRLVNGVRSKIAVKAVGVNGLGEDIKGTVEDDDRNVVAEFATQHLGMGIFALQPQTGKTYKAKIIETGESAFTVDLPQAAEEGLILGLNNSLKDTLYIKIAANEKTVENEKNRTFYLVAQRGGKIYFTTRGKLDGPVFIAKVDKSRFPSGITQFTLFSQTGEPLAERIAFIQSADTLKLRVTGAAQTNITRQKENLTFGVNDNTDKPVTGNFSVAVINESIVLANEDDESTILNNLLLTSDLKGYIEKPNYYFVNRSDKTNADLDILMLTQGYRRFEWKQVPGNNPNKVTWQPETSLDIAGTLKTPKGEPVPDGKITLAAIRQKLFIDTLTDKGGNFKFTGLYLSDTVNVLLRATTANNGNNVKIHVSLPDYPPVIGQKDISDTGGISPEKMGMLSASYNEIQKEKKLQNVRQLKEVKITAKRVDREPEVTYSANLNGPGNADRVITGDKLVGCQNLSDCLQGRIAGVIFKPPGVPFSIRRQARLVVIIDGSLQGGAHLNDINPEDISSIEVLISGGYLAIYGSDAPNGALVITTKRGTGLSYKDIETPSNLITLPFNGFYMARAFY